MKKLLSVLFCLLMTVQCAVFVFAGKFTDVKESHYFYDAVNWAVENGITAGKTATTFAPNESCTRAQAVSFIWRTLGSPEPVGTDNPFTDVKESHYFYKAVLWAVENGITAGMSADKFGPNLDCTRAQIVTFLWNSNGKPEITAENPFTDVKESHWFYKSVLWAVENGITAGMSADKFAPNNKCTRGQIVCFLERCYNKDDALKITKHPSDFQMEYVEGDVLFTVEIEGGVGDYIYEWYVEGEKMGTYSSSYTVDNFSLYVNSHTFDDVVGDFITVVCYVTDANGTTVMSNTAKLYKAGAVIAPLTIKSQPKNYQMTSSQETAQFSIIVEGGAGAYLYEWSLVYDGEVKKVIEGDVTTSTTDTLYYEFSDYDFDYCDGIEVFCVVTDKEGNKVTSNRAVLFPKSSSLPLTIKTQPADYQMTSSMEEATFTVAVDGGARSYLYEWSIVCDGHVKKVVEHGVTSNTSDILSYEFSDYDFDYYRDIEVFCVITDANGDKVTSNTVAVYPKSSSLPLTIKTQPTDYQMTSSMEEATFTVVVDGGARSYLYEWSVICDGQVKEVVEHGVTSAVSDTLSYLFSDYDFDDYRDIEVFCVITDVNGDKVTTNTVEVLQK